MKKNVGKFDRSMKYAAVAIGIHIALVAAGFGQTSSPTPVPEGEVVKISTNLIQVDVTVTDKKGKVIRDLRAEDFEIFENGQKQHVSHLSFIPGVAEQIETRPNTADKTAVRLPPGTIKPDQVRRTIALVVDDLGLSFSSAHFTRQALKKYVNELMQPGDLVAIVRTGAGTGALQQFTADKRILLAAIERVRWNPSGRVGISPFAPIAPTALETAAQGDPSITEEMLEGERNFNNAFDDFRSSAFSVGTLGALRYIIGGMSQLPGRKSVVMFSEGFRLMERDSLGSSGPGTVLDTLRRVADFANRASVVVYTVDPRGLQTLGITAADQVTNTTAEAMTRISSDRRDELFETQSGLLFLARETGGYAILNNNDIAGGVKKILNDQSYYLLAYEPDADTFDAVKRRFNRLEIKVNIKDATVRYRSGFFNVAGGPPKQVPASGSAGQQITTAMLSPFSINDISLSMNTVYGNDEKSGHFVRSFLHIDGDSIEFKTEPDGKKKAQIVIQGASFDVNGNVVEQLGKTFSVTVHNEKGLEELKKFGLLYDFAFVVKKPGAYQYRVAVRDANSAKMGTASQFIEVPNIKKGDLMLSGLILQNLSAGQWVKITKNQAADTKDPFSSPINDTSQRRFRVGTVLRYGFEVYNAKLNPAKRPDLMRQVRVFRDGKLVLEGTPSPFDAGTQTDLKRLKATGAINLGGQIEPGDYILQIIITDNLAKEKRKVATQFIQFEVVP